MLTICEAICSDCGYPMHRLRHIIIRPAVHLPGESNVYVQKGEEFFALHRSARRRVQPETYFDLNKRDENARKLTFLEMAREHRWDRNKCIWVKRIRHDNIISRMYNVSARLVKKILFADATETCVRSSEFRGCGNSKQMTHPSFYDACVALESATQSTICDDSLAEVCSYNMPRQVRQCFGIMTAFGAIAAAARLREKYKRHMLDRNAKKRAEELERLSLQHIQRILNAAEQDIPPMKLHIQRTEIKRRIWQRVSTSVNSNIKAVVDEAINAIYGNATRTKQCFFLHGPAVQYVHSPSDAAIVLASTGIAATLLIVGTTVRSRFRLPSQLFHNSVSSVKADTPEAGTIRKSRLIIWNESCLLQSYALEAVDALLKDFTPYAKRNIAFGGHVVLLGDDWKQMLPVVEDGTTEDIIKNMICNCPLWTSFQILQLTRNVPTGPVDDIDRDDPECVVEQNYLNFTTNPRLPPYELHLKKGAVMMSLRSTKLASGLCNGTRLIVDEMRHNSLLCTILTRTHADKITWRSIHTHPFPDPSVLLQIKPKDKHSTTQTYLRSLLSQPTINSIDVSLIESPSAIISALRLEYAMKQGITFDEVMSIAYACTLSDCGYL
uniref:ATP-dependent DNA helicase n=1 Tax=Ascaris lumbricoides TaxID=6252 RepID=A0A0M3IH79_ASCLU